jgi:uncharacterized pyridoxamine 5'-phosphate oxidase family protein
LHLKKENFISKKGHSLVLKVIQAFPNLPNPVTEAEINTFLESKLNIQLSVIDEEGYPSIHPLWFLYDKDSGKIYTSTQKTTKKARHLYENPNKIYFSIDDENFPYKGVKGRAKAKISEDIDFNIPIVEKINLKYLGNTEHPLAHMIMENTRKGIQIVIEIIPKYFSAWDFGKAM